MADPRKKTVQYPSIMPYQPGNTGVTYGGLPVNVTTQTSGSGQLPTAGTGATRPTYDATVGTHGGAAGSTPAPTRTAAVGSGAGTVTNRMYDAPIGPEQLEGYVPGEGTMGPQKYGTADKDVFGATEEKKSGGRGAAVKPKLPQEIANDIAASYARMQQAGPDAYTDPYQAQIEAMQGRRFGEYDSRYIPQIDRLTDRLLNRDPFRYNWSDDPLYRQYAARYQQQARQGMQDTMGQAAAMTGGYGSSYATAAASQAYANQMAGLNDRAMDLYRLAADRYDQEGADMRANLQALETREAQNRGNWESDRSTFYNREDADLANLRNSQAMNYQMWADELARDQYERELARQMYQYWNNLAENNYTR